MTATRIAFGGLGSRASGVGSRASGVGARHLMSLTHCLVNGADSGGRFVLRRKTQVRGRSDRAIAARRKVCSAHENELKRGREDPENSSLDLITDYPTAYFDFSLDSA